MKVGSLFSGIGGLARPRAMRVRLGQNERRSRYAIKQQSNKVTPIRSSLGLRSWAALATERKERTEMLGQVMDQIIQAMLGRGIVLAE